MSGMFCGASSFTSDLSAWQTGQVTNMSGMFCGASSFDGDVSCWGHHSEVVILFSDSHYKSRCWSARPMLSVFKPEYRRIVT
jgi:surface protein